MKYLLVLLVSFFLMQFPAVSGATEGVDCTNPDSTSPYKRWCGDWRGKWGGFNPTGLTVILIQDGKVRGWYLWRDVRQQIAEYNRGAISGNTLQIEFPNGDSARYDYKNGRLEATYCFVSGSCQSKAILRQTSPTITASRAPALLIGPPPEDALDCTSPDPSSIYKKWCGVWKGEMVRSRNPIRLKVTHVSRGGEVYGIFSWKKMTPWRIHPSIAVGKINGDVLTITFPKGDTEIFTHKGDQLSVSYCPRVGCEIHPMRGNLKKVSIQPSVVGTLK